MGRHAPLTALRACVAALRACVAALRVCVAALRVCVAALRIHRKGPTRAQHRLCASGAKSIAPSSPPCLIAFNMQPGIDLPPPSGAKQGHDVLL